MKRIRTILVIIIIALAYLMTGCLPLSQLESARTVGEGHWSLGATVIGYRKEDSLGGIVNNPDFEFLPSLEINAAYGINERTDIRMTINSFLFTRLDVKHMIVGDDSSKFAMSTGFAAAFSLNTAEPTIHINLPLYLSWHFDERSYLFVIPALSYLSFYYDGEFSVSPQ